VNSGLDGSVESEAVGRNGELTMCHGCAPRRQAMQNREAADHQTAVNFHRTDQKRPETRILPPASQQKCMPDPRCINRDAMSQVFRCWN
jgi:hypothetical protein